MSVVNFQRRRVRRSVAQLVEHRSPNSAPLCGAVVLSVTLCSGRHHRHELVDVDRHSNGTPTEPGSPGELDARHGPCPRHLNVTNGVAAPPSEPITHLPTEVFLADVFRGLDAPELPSGRPHPAASRIGGRVERGAARQPARDLVSSRMTPSYTLNRYRLAYLLGLRDFFFSNQRVGSSNAGWRGSRTRQLQALARPHKREPR